MSLSDYVDIGYILYQRVSERVDFDFDGNMEEFGVHEEPWLIEDIKGNTMKLYNLSNQRKYKMTEKEFNYLLKIKKIRISKERG